MKSIQSPASTHQIEAAWGDVFVYEWRNQNAKIFHQLFCFQVTVQERLFGQKI